MSPWKFSRSVPSDSCSVVVEGSKLRIKDHILIQPSKLGIVLLVLL